MLNYDAIIWTINLVICLLPPLYTLWFFIARKYYTGSIEVNVGLCVMSLAFSWNITTILAVKPENLQWDYTFGRALFFVAFVFLIQIIKRSHRDKDKHTHNLKAGEPS